MPTPKVHSKMLATIAANIKRLRIEKEMSQQDLGNQIDKNKQSIQKLETGLINPRFLTLVEVSEGLGVSMKDILKDVF